MKTIELNIGLSNNPLDVVDILIEVKSLLKAEVLNSDIVEGEYNGSPEETLIILAKTDLDARELDVNISLLVGTLHQESIAYTVDGLGILRYAFFFDGDRQEFNYNFFQTLQTFGKGTRTGGLLNTGHGHPAGVIKRR